MSHDNEHARDDAQEQDTAAPDTDVRAEAERIVNEGEQVRERTRRAFVDAFGDGVPTFRRLNDLAERVLDGATSGLREAKPKDRESALNEVVDGIADGMSSTATAARLAMEEAASRGKQFAKEDLDQLVDDLQALEGMFLDTVERTVKSAGSAVSDQANDLVSHARRAWERARPSIQSALDQARRHPGDVATDAAKGAARAVPATAGMLLQTMSGLLQGAGDALLGENRKDRDRADNAAADE